MQFGGGDSNLVSSHGCVVLGVLIGYSISSGSGILLEYAGSIAGANVCTACCRVDCPVYGQRTVDIYLGIQQIRIFAIICFAGSIPHCNKLTVASIVVRNPLVTVIDIDAVATGNNHFSVLRDISLHTRQQSRRLVNGELTAFRQVHSHVVRQRQDITLGTDVGACQRKIQIVDLCLTIHGIDDTVCRSVVLLSQAAGNHLKHTIVSHEGNHGIVDATAGIDSSVHLFTGTLFQCQRRFNILHIILAEWKYLISHAHGSRTTTEVRDLIPLVGCTTGFHGDRTGAGHKAPGIQAAVFLYNNGAACVQPNLTIVAGHITGG